jgi:hypothetical protein
MLSQKGANMRKLGKRQIESTSAGPEILVLEKIVTVKRQFYLLRQCFVGSQKILKQLKVPMGWDKFGSFDVINNLRLKMRLTVKKM